MNEKEKQEASLIGRILCMETLILLMGLFYLGSGVYTGETMQLFWGGVIITGAILLHLVKKKDWKKHWEEQEKMQQVYEEMKRRKKEDEDAGK